MEMMTRRYKFEVVGSGEVGEELGLLTRAPITMAQANEDVDLNCT
jgi:hypothetical protein